MMIIVQFETSDEWNCPPLSRNTWPIASSSVFLSKNQAMGAITSLIYRDGNSTMKVVKDTSAIVRTALREKLLGDDYAFQLTEAGDANFIYCW